MLRTKPPVSAGELLAKCELACPPGLETTSVRPAPRWLKLVWRGQFAAITLPWSIYVRGSVTASPEFGGVLLHELVHAEQWRRLGIVGFLRTYLTQYLQGRWKGQSHLDAYAAISLEAEARNQPQRDL